MPAGRDGVQRAALRLALPQMVRHGSSMNPLNYALWYIFVAGSVPALVQEVRGQLEAQDPLTPTQVRTFFDHDLNDDEALYCSKANGRDRVTILPLCASLSEGRADGLWQR